VFLRGARPEQVNRVPATETMQSERVQTEPWKKEFHLEVFSRVKLGKVKETFRTGTNMQYMSVPDRSGKRGKKKKEGGETNQARNPFGLI